MFGSLAFWTVIATLGAYILNFFFPNFPYNQAQILSGILFLLGLIGIVPQLRAMKFGVTWSDLFHSAAFWTLVGGLASFVILFYYPSFPLIQAQIVAILFWVLSLFGIVPTLQKMAALSSSKKK